MRGRAKAGAVAAIIAAMPWLGCGAAFADAGCPDADSVIVPDRGDVTNSSIVVPAGSLQAEHGLELTSQGGTRSLALPNGRLRLGIVPCAELLLDLPSYQVTTRGRADGGFADAAPAVKFQLGPLPGDFELAIIAGMGVPTGTRRIAGTGVQPYLQLPWSRDLGGGWDVSGMVTAFSFPSDPQSKLVTQASLALDRDIGEDAGLFLEYAGAYPSHAGPTHLVNTGGAYRLSPVQQVDLHVAFGVNRAAPRYILGVGYSIRFDRLF